MYTHVVYTEFSRGLLSLCRFSSFLLSLSYPPLLTQEGPSLLRVHGKGRYLEREAEEEGAESGLLGLTFPSLSPLSPPPPSERYEIVQFLLRQYAREGSLSLGGGGGRVFQFSGR